MISYLSSFALLVFTYWPPSPTVCVALSGCLCSRLQGLACTGYFIFATGGVSSALLRFVCACCYVVWSFIHVRFSPSQLTCLQTEPFLFFTQSASARGLDPGSSLTPYSGALLSYFIDFCHPGEVVTEALTSMKYMLLKCVSFVFAMCV